jgi:hypothetical protein
MHLHKVGGSSLRKLIEINSSHIKPINVTKTSADLKFKKKHVSYYLRKYRDLFEIRGNDKTNKLKFIYGHSVFWGIHEQIDQEVRYILLLRNPEKRAVSLYNFYLTNYFKQLRVGADTSEVSTKLLKGTEVPDFYSWLKNKYAKISTGTETVTQHLMKQGFLKDNSRKSMEEMLDKFYFIGITEHLDDELDYLAGTWGFNRFIIRQNISKKFITKIKQQKTRELLKAKNKDDNRLYELAVKKRIEFIKDHPEYYKIVRKNRLKRKFFLPFTQLLYNPKGTLIDFSASMKRNFPVYEKVFDKIRGYTPIDEENYKQ